MKLSALFRRSNPQREAAHTLYVRLVEKARDPVFYRDLAVPDTVNGRFDMVVLHVMLAIRRLRAEGAGTEELGKYLLEIMFQDMDRSLREMGVGDMSIGKHIKRMAKAFYGRSEMYEGGLDGDDATMATALTANIYRASQPTAEQVTQMAGYLRRMSAHLAAQPMEKIAADGMDLAVPVIASTP